MVLSRIVWALCLIASAALYLFSDSYLALVVLLVVIAVPLLAVVLNQIFSRKISAQLTVSMSAEKHQDLLCNLQTSNTLPLPLTPILCKLRCKNVFTGEEINARVMYPVGGRSSYQLPLAFASSHCGSLDISVEVLQAFDLFGLSSTSQREETKAAALVLPRTFAPSISVVPNPTKDIEADEYSPNKAGADPSETFAIREYRPGDSLKRIHWKLSSKFDNLIVKEPGLPVRHSFLVLLETFYPDTVTADASVSDTLGEILLSLCQTLVEEEISFEVGWQNHEENAFMRYRITTMDDLSGILDKMFRASACEGALDAFTCYTEAFGSSEFEHLLYISRFIPSSIDSFIGDGQLTAIICAEDVLNVVSDTSSGYFVHYCTPQSYEAELVSLSV